MELFLCFLSEQLNQIISHNNLKSSNKTSLEDTACYAGLLLAPAEGFGLRPEGQKKMLLCCFAPFLAIFGVQ